MRVPCKFLRSLHLRVLAGEKLFRGQGDQNTGCGASPSDQLVLPPKICRDRGKSYRSAVAAVTDGYNVATFPNLHFSIRDIRWGVLNHACVSTGVMKDQNGHYNGEGIDQEKVDDPSSRDDKSTASGSSSGSDEDKDTETGKDGVDSSKFGNTSSRDISRDNFSCSCYGFPELTNPENGGAFNADADLENKKNLAQGAWSLLTGEEPTATGAYHLISGSPSLSEVGIGVAVGFGVLLFGAESLAGGAALESADAILGTNILSGVGTFVQQVRSAAGLGAITSETVGLYEKVKTRVEGFVKFNEAAHRISQSRAPEDHTPGEARTTQRNILP